MPSQHIQNEILVVPAKPIVNKSYLAPIIDIQASRPWIPQFSNLKMPVDGGRIWTNLLNHVIIWNHFSFSQLELIFMLMIVRNVKHSEKLEMLLG